MIHTATLSYRPTAEQYKRFKSHSHYDKKIKQWVNDDYSDNGILLFAYFTYNGFAGDHFICRINFHKLVDQNDKITTYSNADYSEMISRFNQIMEDLGGLPPFEEWYARRIDYCINVNTRYVADYIRLMQKGDIPYSQTLAYDKDTRHRTRKEGSVYYPSRAYDKRKRRTGSVTINFYDKYDERMKQGITGEELEKARNILRLEVQCHRPKLDALKQKYNMPDRKITNFLDPEVGYDVLSRYLNCVDGNADYNRRSSALARVDQLHCQSKTKEQLKMIIKEIARQYQSIWSIRNQLVVSGSMTREQYNDYLKILYAANINPVTISDNRSLKPLTLIEGLPCVFGLFNEAYRKEMELDQLEPVEVIEDIQDIM